jgi:hypothetical protein
MQTSVASIAASTVATTSSLNNGLSTVSPTNVAAKGTGLSAGAIGGIVGGTLGCLCLLLLFGVVFYTLKLLTLKKLARHVSGRNMDSDYEMMQGRDSENSSPQQLVSYEFEGGALGGRLDPRQSV